MLQVRLLGPLEADVDGRSRRAAREQPRVGAARLARAAPRRASARRPGRALLARRAGHERPRVAAQRRVGVAAGARRRAAPTRSSPGATGSSCGARPTCRSSTRCRPWRARGRGGVAPRAAAGRPRRRTGSSRSATARPRGSSEILAQLALRGADAAARGRACAPAPGARSARRGSGARPHAAPCRQRRPRRSAGGARPARRAAAIPARARSVGGDARRRPRACAACPPPTAGAVPGPAPVIGRDAELDALLALRSGVAVVRGEAGIGKTRLAHELVERSRAAGARTASCAALELGGPAPVLAVVGAPARPGRGPLASPGRRDLARGSRGHRTVAAAQARPPAAAPSGASAAPEHVRSRLLEAAVDAIEHAVADRPLVLLFDDVHLADAASLELLAYVLRRFAGLGVLAVLTCRAIPERPDLDALLRAHAGRGGELLELDLLPLARDHVERLVATVADLAPGARAQVIAAADGNPLLAIEGARASAAGRDGPAAEPAGRRPRRGRAPAGRRPARGRARGCRRARPHADGGGALASRRTCSARWTAGCSRPSTAGSATATRCCATPPWRTCPSRSGAPCTRSSRARCAARGGDRAPSASRRPRRRAAERLARAARDAIAVGAVEEAAAFLREALELRPGDPALLVELAQAEAWSGRRAAAEEALRATLDRLAPTDHAARGAVHARAARWYSGALCRPADTLAQAQRAIAELDRDTLSRRRASSAARSRSARGARRSPGASTMPTRCWSASPASSVAIPTSICELANAQAFRALAEDRLDDAAARFRVDRRDAGPGDPIAPTASASTWPASSPRSVATRRRCAAPTTGSPRSRGLPGLVAPLHAVRAKLLTSLGRLAEARDAIAQERMRGAAQRQYRPSPRSPTTTPAWSRSPQATTTPPRSCCWRGPRGRRRRQPPAGAPGRSPSRWPGSGGSTKRRRSSAPSRSSRGPRRPAGRARRVAHVRAGTRGPRAAATSRSPSSACRRQPPLAPAARPTAARRRARRRPRRSRSADAAPVHPARELERVERELRHVPDPVAPGEPCLRSMTARPRARAGRGGVEARCTTPRASPSGGGASATVGAHARGRSRRLHDVSRRATRTSRCPRTSAATCRAARSPSRASSATSCSRTG